MAENVKPCIECKSEIPVDSSKCAQCQSFQNWRRFLDVSNSVLALLVALVAVIGVVVPALITAMHTPKSEVKLGAYDLQSIELQPNAAEFVVLLAVTNIGDRPASFAEATLKCSDEYAFSRTEMRVEGRPIVVPGGELVMAQLKDTFSFDDPDGLSRFKETSAALVDYIEPEFIAIELHVFNFDGSGEALRTDIGWEMMNALKDKVDREDIPSEEVEGA